jgi:hypothetical protein
MRTSNAKKGTIPTEITSSVIAAAAAVVNFRNGARNRQYSGQVA